MSRPAVPFVRGEWVRLPSHPEACSLENLQKYVGTHRSVGRPLAVDLFCGAGGLSLGLEMAGFDLILGVDRYQTAVDTHRAHFGGASICADLSEPGTVQQIKDALRGVSVDLVAGGPPCQSFSSAGRGKIRSLIEDGTWERDSRGELWRAFVAVVEQVLPQAVLVENVPEMALGEGSIEFRRLVEALENLGYAVHTRILAAKNHGVPQHRQRLFVVGLLGRQSGSAVFNWPEAAQGPCPVLRDAIGDLPVVPAAHRECSIPYGGSATPFQKWCREGLTVEESSLVYDHITRAVRDDDLEAFELMDHRTSYSDLPQRLRRYRSDIFDDKYKRLSWGEPSRSITAHLSRDGYWYIHPEQHRSLSIREAARVQSFPDRYRFAGTPKHAYHQIGEAVPPLLAQALGQAVLRSIETTERGRHLAGQPQLLKEWLAGLSTSELHAPWRASGSPWLVLLGMLLLEKLPSSRVHSSWRICRERWPEPAAFLTDTRRHNVLLGLRREAVEEMLVKLASLLEGKTELHGEELTIPGLAAERIEVALGLCGKIATRRPTAAAARVAGRVFGEGADTAGLSAQLLLARLVGVDEDGRGYAGVLEVADRFCRPDKLLCKECPLAKVCICSTADSATRLSNSGQSATNFSG